MNQAQIKFPDVPGKPTVSIDLEDGFVVGLEAVLPHLDAAGALRLCQVLVGTGEVLENSGNYAASCPAYEAAARAAEAANNPLNQSVCLNNLGLAYKRQGRYDKAITSYEKAIALVTQPISDPDYEAMRLTRLASSLCNLAILYQTKPDREKQYSHAAWALRIVEPRKDPESLRIAQECKALLR